LNSDPMNYPAESSEESDPKENKFLIIYF